MPLQTNLNVSPYFDDFDENKNFYKIMFQPGVAVQARELNQLQTILQNQIERFGDNIFKKGTIVDGCNITFVPALNYVKLRDTEVDNPDVPLNVQQFIGFTVRSESTGLTGTVSYDEFIDTTYWAVRLEVKGDTISTGNIVSVADAQKVNQFVLGTATPAGFDFHSSDVNGDNQITISDAYVIFGRIAGRFNTWVNNVKDIKFFTATEYNTLSTATTNLTATTPGVTNFTYDIVAGQPNSVTYYVLGMGDANGTGI